MHPGETKVVHTPAGPTYRAFRVKAEPGERITAAIASENGDARIWITNDKFETVAKMDDSPAPGLMDMERELIANGHFRGHVLHTVKSGATHYIAFREAGGHQATIRIGLAPPPPAPPAPGLGPKSLVDDGGRGVSAGAHYREEMSAQRRIMPAVPANPAETTMKLALSACTLTLAMLTLAIEKGDASGREKVVARAGDASGTEEVVAAPDGDPSLEHAPRTTRRMTPAEIDRTPNCTLRRAGPFHINLQMRADSAR